MDGLSLPQAKRWFEHFANLDKDWVSHVQPQYFTPAELGWITQSTLPLPGQDPREPWITCIKLKNGRGWPTAVRANRKLVASSTTYAGGRRKWHAHLVSTRRRIGVIWPSKREGQPGNEHWWPFAEIVAGTYDGKAIRLRTTSDLVEIFVKPVGSPVMQTVFAFGAMGAAGDGRYMDAEASGGRAESIEQWRSAYKETLTAFADAIALRGSQI